jgi:hypothetical protein
LLGEAPITQICCRYGRHRHIVILDLGRILCVWSNAASYIGDAGAAVVTVWHGCVSGLSLVPFRNIQGRQARSIRGSVELRRGPGAGPVGVRRGTEG